MGKIITYLCDTCDVQRGMFDCLTKIQVKHEHTYAKVAEDNEWTIQMGKELIKARNWKSTNIEIPGF